jgi:nucleoside-diphosphate-sugar epimerase
MSPVPSLPCRPEHVDAFLSNPLAGSMAVMREVDGPVLVLGAGGKMGLHLCRMLKECFLRQGKQNAVIAVSRFQSLRDQEAYREVGIETVVADLSDEDAVRALPDCPVVFYLVGTKFGTQDNPELLQRINVDISRSVAERFKASKLVVFSTGCVYSFTTPESGGSREESPCDPPGAYARSCLGREAAFAEASRRHGTEGTLIRLNYSVEFRYGVPVDIARKVLQGEPIDVTTGYVNVIWQSDALNQIIQTLQLCGSPTVPVNITGPEVVSVRAIARRFGDYFGREPVFVGETAPTAWLSNASWSHRLFGRPVTGLETMLGWIAAWLLASGETFNKPTGFEKRDGNF